MQLHWDPPTRVHMQHTFTQTFLLVNDTMAVCLQSRVHRSHKCTHRHTHAHAHARTHAHTHAGADPAFDVFKLGEDMGFKPGAKLKYMALGQGMGPKAAEFIEMGVTRGLWIMLQVSAGA